MKVVHQAINLLYINLHGSSSLIQIQNQTFLLVKSLILGSSGFHEGLDPKSLNWHVCIYMAHVTTLPLKLWQNARTNMMLDKTKWKLGLKWMGFWLGSSIKMSMKALHISFRWGGCHNLTLGSQPTPKMNNKVSFIRWNNINFWSSFDIKPIKGLKYGMNARESKHILTCSYVWESKGRTPKLNSHFEIKSLWGVLNL